MDDRQDATSAHQDAESAPQDAASTQQDEGALHHHAHLPENETQRLHRLVIPMILDILRSRGEQRPAARDNDAEQDPWHDMPPLSPLDNMDVDEGHRTHGHDAEGGQSDGDQEPMLTDQQGQTLPSPAAPDETEASAPSSSSSPSSPSAPRRPRYRLVVYFEERELMNEAGANADPSSSSPSDGEPSLARALRNPSLPQDEEDTPPPRHHRPSRYVAIFSIDSDAHNMPIIHSAGLQPSPASFEDILNQLFASYMPKGTPPAKKEIIDSLPTTTDSCAEQTKCAVCLEQFTEGAEVVVLPCSHRFHGEDCVKPWLRMHSSCPICRYEMPVDDAEYEEKRKERMAKRAAPPVDSQHDVTCDDLPLL